MSARAMHCLGCGVDFAAFGGPVRMVAAFNAHSCVSPAVAAELNDVRRLHPSHPTWTPGGAA
jgi:hypothetical protein